MGKTSVQPNKKLRVSLWQLFWTFFKTGLFTFGGGYAMIAVLEEELVTRRKWITSGDMLDMLVIAESTPGVIAVNTATGVGYRTRGVWGAIVATVGVVLPSFAIITALSFAIRALSDNLWYKAAFTGVQACVTVLVLNAFVKMFNQLERGWFSALLLVAAFNVALFTNFNVIFLILIGGAAGIVYALVADAIVKRRNKPLPIAQGGRLEGKTDDSDADGGDK